ncbi:MAG: ParB/RepB/Spo0J family partition protein [Gammaproteobacteria bacterium]|nr:ParB/RepB/Spo0J family partition protein [Gammaproteobacteria bacterium]
MAAKRKGLGRGLDVLLSTPAVDTGNKTQGDLLSIDIDLLEPGQYQPRVDMRQETLAELASSITAQGVVQPIVIRPVGKKGDRYEIIAGERRWRAAQMAGLSQIPAVVRDISDAAAVAMALIENIQREDLNPLEEARALERLIDEFDMTHQGAADAVGRSRASVTNLLRLLDLDDAVAVMVEHREIEMGHARALLGLSGKAQLAAAREVASRGLSVRETERLVKKLQGKKNSKGKARKASVDPDVQRLENELSERLGAAVSIRHESSGKGALEIRYHSLDELEGILQRIRG